jgi:hypothetical protein
MGVLVQIVCFIFFPLPIAILLTIVLGFFSHFLIDSLAKMTYHTPESHKEEKFWVIWHIITPTLIGVLVLWVVLINWMLVFFFILGGVSANLMDIWDWVILRPKQRKIKAEDPNAKFWGDNLFLHSLKDRFQEKVPPFSWLPNWNYKKKGVIIEIITITILWILVAYFLGIYLA